MKNFPWRNNRPMTEKRLADLEQMVVADLARSIGTGHASGPGHVGELLAEVRRLQREKDRVEALIGLHAVERDMEEQRAERAEAALARVTDDAMVERIAEALHGYYDFQYDECHHGTYSGGPSHGEPFAMCRMAAPRVLAAIRTATTT